jgi:hypothetical protein
MKVFTASYNGRTPSDILRSKSSMLAVFSAPPAAISVYPSFTVAPAGAVDGQRHPVGP